MPPEKSSDSEPRISRGVCVGGEMGIRFDSEGLAPFGHKPMMDERHGYVG